MTSNDQTIFKNISTIAVNGNCIVIPNTPDGREALAKKVITLRKLVKEASIKIMLTEKEAATLLGVHESWLRSRRKSGKSEFPYYKIGDNSTGSVRYNLLDIEAFTDSRKFMSTTQQQAHTSQQPISQ